MSLDTPATVFLIENHDAMHDFVCFVSDILTFSRFYSMSAWIFVYYDYYYYLKK